MPFAAGIFYQQYGQGIDSQTPLVLIHGAGGSHLHWPPQVRRLHGCRVYALDLPGHGKSSGEGCRSVLDYTRQVIEWLADTGLPPAVFAGHSLGSAIVLTLALEQPELVLGLALLGGAARLRVNPALLANAASPETFETAVEQVTAWSYAPTTPARLVELATARMAETPPPVLYADFLACQAFDLSARLAELHRPALVLCGEADRMTPPQMSEQLAAKLPNARLVIIPDAGHMVMIEQPGPVAQVLSRFIYGVPDK
jgi:pimeloyl-ACP methyl ester carboxylesterase